MPETTPNGDAAERGVARRVPIAAADLLPLLYDDLRAAAERQLAREGPGRTLQATALVHEAYLRLLGDADPGWEGRGHFFGAAACAMRRILVERARRAAGLAREVEGSRVLLDAAASVSDAPDVDVLALDEALTRLAGLSPRRARAVELVYFAGLSLEDAARALGVSLTTLKSDWRFARSWLYRELSRGGGR